jgi:hypothetical protein
MTSHVELDIAAPQARVAELFVDPRNNPRWMDDLDHIEPVSGELGEAGSSYRLVPKRGSMGSMIFVATIVTRALPSEVRLLLRARRISMHATGRFVRVSNRRTRLISEEVFTFDGVVQKVIGFFARRSIAAAHRRHMESFKRFAESAV